MISVVPGLALIISLVSLFLSFRNNAAQRKAMILAKKTEVIEKVAQRQSKLGHLVLVYTQMLQLQKTIFGADPTSHIYQRVDSNLALVLAAKQNGDDLLVRLRNTAPTDIEAWETLLSSANEFLIHVNTELEKERAALEELRNAIAGQ